MGTPDPDSAVVVPLDASVAECDPWQLLASGEGMLVSWSDDDTSAAVPWGRPLRATSVLAQQVQRLAEHAGQGVVKHGTRRFRLELPDKFGTEDLIGAVGGGFRAAVRSPGSSRIAGQAVLKPLPSGAKLVSVGKVLGPMAVIVAAEMLAGDEQDAKLTAILEGVERIDATLAMETDARLATAEQTLRQAHTALLDGARIPESVGLGTAMNNLQLVRNTSTALLAGWERAVAALPAGPVDGAELRTALGGPGAIGWDGFAAAVRTAYLAITLDARRTMLTAAKAQLSNPDLPLAAFQRHAEDDLAARTAELDRLRTLLDRLSTIPLTVSGWGAGVLPHLVSKASDENGRTQALFTTLSAALRGAPRAAPPSRVEAQVMASGEVQLLRPAALT